MANPWFRLYSEFADDPKVQMMSEPMQRRLIMLFCSKCKGETLHETELAFHWRISETELAETKAVFLAKGFIDEDWNIENWNKRQFISDSSTDRVRKYRQAKKQDETLHETPETKPPVTVTPPDTEQIQNRTEHKKPSSRKKRESEPHPLFASVKDMMFGYYRSKNSGVDPEWNGREAKHLSELLAANPKAPIEHWRRCLEGRYRSQVNHAERPGIWIPKLSSFAQPVDRFNQPQGEGNGQSGEGRSSAGAVARQERSFEAIHRGVGAVAAGYRPFGRGA